MYSRAILSAWKLTFLIIERGFDVFHNLPRRFFLQALAFPQFASRSLNQQLQS